MGQSASQNENSFPESGVSINTDATGASGDSAPVPLNELDIYECRDKSDGAVTSTQKKNVVTTVFRWKGGGGDVQLATSLHNRTIPMHRSGHDFTCILDMPRGKHAFRYLVDNEWKYDTESRKATDEEGNVHNFVDLTDFKNHDQREKERKREMKRSNTAFPMNKYGFKMLDHTDFTTEPPQLPPHLRHIILNNQDTNLENPSELPEPQTVTLNHLFCTAVKHDLMVLGTTSRYKKKFVTTVLYSKANLRR